MIPLRAMARRKGGGARQPITPEQHRFVKAVTGAIIKRAEGVLHLSRDELAAKAGKKSASTLYGWRNGWRGSPALLDVQAYASAVGLTLVLSDGTSQQAACGRPHVTSDFEKNLLVAVRALTDDADRDELLTMVRDFVLAHTSGSRGPPSGPLVPAEQVE